MTRWPAYLRDNSGLPGPRANLELAQAVADVGDPALFDRLIATDDEYLVFCGVIGLGRRLADDPEKLPAGPEGLPDGPEGLADGPEMLVAGAEMVADGPEGLADGAEMVARLHAHAADPRWRVREAVAMALQRLGDADLSRLMPIVLSWATDPHPLVQRAAVAAVCEPRLLSTGPAAACAVEVCARATAALAGLPVDRRRDADVRALRQALGYCWSVAVAAEPATGLPRFTGLDGAADPDVAWILRENRKKARLARLP